MTWNKNACSENMQKTINVLNQELAGIKAGRANPALLNPVVVDSYGQKMKVVQVATVNIVDNFTLSVSPYDKSTAGAVEKAIQEANLGVSASRSGDAILVKIPKMTEDSRKDWIKFAKKTAEGAKVSIRSIRKDWMGELKKMEGDKLLSEDEKEREEKVLQKLTDDFITKIDEALAKKEKDIMEV